MTQKVLGTDELQSKVLPKVKAYVDAHSGGNETLEQVLTNGNEATRKTIVIKHDDMDARSTMDYKGIKNRSDDGGITSEGIFWDSHLSLGDSETGVGSENANFYPSYLEMTALDDNGDPVNSFRMDCGLNGASVSMSNDLKTAWKTALDVGGGGSYTAGDGIDITNDVISNKIKLEYNSLTGNNVLISQQGATLFDNIGLQFDTSSQAQSTTLTYVKGLPVGGVALAHTGYVDNKLVYSIYNNEWIYRINGNSFEAIYNVNRTLAIDTAEGALFRSAAQTLTVPTAFLQGKTLTIKSFSANLMKSGVINWVTADNINGRSVTWYAISPTSLASDTYALSVVIKGTLA